MFGHADDKKKAAGRALGTLVEVITFYLLRSWGFEHSIAIERPLPEYSNESITHNVEYSLHPSTTVADLSLPNTTLPISTAKICKALSAQGTEVPKSQRKANQLLSSGRVLRNACTIANEGASFLVATLGELLNECAEVIVSRLANRPFAIVECKRVGIEEGAGKGPQTIEKAKQGAYVARTVSSLQRIRLPDGTAAGVFASSDGKLTSKPYNEYVQEIIESHDRELLRDFVLTVGVVSNHGNWFTSDDHNKELRVLTQSYDWLLFLTDEGLCQFVCDLITEPAAPYQPVRNAFLASYEKGGGANRFTKVQMAYEADRLLVRYFSEKAEDVRSWFNVIAPAGKNLTLLQHELTTLIEARKI